MVMLKECKTNELPKQVAADTTEGTRKRGRQRDGWGGKVEEGLNALGIGNGQPMARDCRFLFFYSAGHV
jgi:hypothetical protein